ncbi:intermediate transcription factor [Squirrelpox virus]|uniref:Intermediate transcription factor 3 small subunit n=1 Tax=Squirrelpox virus TaxID=240426 RepID=U3UBJ9_9POXV|nr:intermediate transcription factor [Squirrelpox virus]CCD83279.1 intermediate transcription factor [Squirrelpox virus]
MFGQTGAGDLDRGLVFEPVPDMQLEAALELGDVGVEDTRASARENPSFVLRSRRVFPHRTKDDERKLALGFFLPRLYFLSHREIRYLFSCVDAVKHVSITKKNNVIVAPYITLLAMAARGYRLTDTMLERFFPELHSEHSKKFRFEAQVRVIQEKLGYAQGNYHVYEFEHYYATVALVLRGPASVPIFDTRAESAVVISLSEITYRIYFMHLRSDAAQWSVSTAAIVNQMINTVLVTVYELMARAAAEGRELRCALAREHEFPFGMLLERLPALARLVEDLRRARSCRVGRRDRETLLGFCRLVGGRGPAPGLGVGRVDEDEPQDQVHQHADQGPHDRHGEGVGAQPLLAEVEEHVAGDVDDAVGDLE